MKEKEKEKLSVVSWNVTRKCNLRCGHCYLPAVSAGDGVFDSSNGDELSTSEALRLIDEIRLVNPETLLIISGGEPLLRPDVFELASHARKAGMMVVVGTNGTLLDGPAARKLKESGVSGVSIGLDSAGPVHHDAVRGCPGAWAAAVEAAGLCRAQGIEVQVNTVVTSGNLEEIPELIEFARALGAKVFSPFFLVCTGRAEEMTDITPSQYEEVLSLIAGLSGNSGQMMIRTRCAPTIRRILHAKAPDSPLLQMDAGRCLAGRTYCRIAPDGTVTACPYLPLPLGNARGGEFGRIWEPQKSPVLESLRAGARDLKGKCGACRYRLLCGGCRARAYAMRRDYLGEDPWCAYRPAPGEAETEAVRPPTVDNEYNELPYSTPTWSREADDRLLRVPFFVRPMVKAAVERYAMERGCLEITPEIMDEVKGRMRRPAMNGHGNSNSKTHS